MPQLVWYAPLVTLEQRKIGDAWQRSGENGAFYGSYSF